MKISACMKHDVVSIQASASIGDAARLMVENHIGTLPVVDPDGKLVGLLPLRDLLNLVMPDFLRLMEDFDFVHDFGALENRQPSTETLNRPVHEVMLNPISVEENSGLLRASALMNHHRITDLPVVAPGGRLVGLASRVDIGVALISGWNHETLGGRP